MSDGQKLYDTAARLFPICRSITGDGVRQSLAVLREIAPIETVEIASGTPILDWTTPKEGNIRDAWIKNAAGERVVDFRANNLHILQYSVPVRAKLPLAELKKHIFTIPAEPDLIPYRTSYYSERWGFCMTQRALDALPDGDYEACVDSTLEDGALTYGELVLPGEIEDEILISSHICHPSLANDNCAGLSLAAHLAAALAQEKRRHTFRFVFAPGTVGAIAWLAQNEARAHKIKHGLVVSGVGDAGGPTYKRTRRGDAPIDRAMTHVLSFAGPNARVIDFSPYGYDERQYNSPGFLLDVGLLQRSEFGGFREYHTSADNLDFIAPDYLAASFGTIRAGLDILERNRTMVNLHPKGEPQLGRRGLYAAIGGDKDSYAKNMAMLWALNLSDGRHTLLDIATRAKLPFATIADIAETLEKAALLREVASA
jgi:aminopeptidase-like protein